MTGISEPVISGGSWDKICTRGAGNFDGNSGPARASPIRLEIESSLTPLECTDGAGYAVPRTRLGNNQVFGVHYDKPVTARDEKSV